MEERRNKKKKEGQKGRRNSGGKEERKKEKKKSFAGFKTSQVSSAGSLVCGMGRGVWKDWFHFFPFLSHTLHCCPASSPVSQGPSAPH